MPAIVSQNDHAPLPAEQPSTEWTARIASMTLRDAARPLPYATIAAALAVIIVRQPLGIEPQLPHAPVFWAATAAAVIVAVAVRMVLRRRAASGRESASVDGAASWLLALQLGLFLLLVSVIAATRTLPEDGMSGWIFGFVNKRWLVASYSVTILTILVLPVAVHRIRGQVSAALGDRTRRSNPPEAWRRWLKRAAGAMVVIALAWYFAGPPWHLERHHRTIDWHEQAHLGSLQAISKGYLPFIGPASTGYGPGSQLMMYETMQALGHFDIPAFRSAWAVFDLIGLFIVAGVAYYWIGIIGVLAVVPLALAYSPFGFYGTYPDGTFGGYYGWANPLRYAGAIVVVPALASLVSDDARSRRHPLALAAVALGSVWGLSAWFAQENLSATVVAGGLVLVLLWLTRSATGSQTLRVVRDVAIGFLCVATPILGYYAWHGALRDFTYNYLLVPRTVAAGYSNMWWPNATLPERTTYYFTFPLLMAMAVCTIWRVPAIRVEPLDFNRRRLLSFLCVQLACFQTVLLRSDTEHLTNALAALPFVLVLGIVDLPRFVATRWPARIAVGGVFLSLVLLIFPTLRTTQWDRLVLAPVAKLRPHDDLSPVPIKYGNRVGFKRATRWLADEPTLAVGSGLSMREFLDFVSDLHDLVGPRKTYVAGVGGGCMMTVRGDCAWAGAVYFMADLMPAPFLLDRDMMTFNEPLRRQAIDHIRTHGRDYECVITNSLATPESEAFLSTHPDATVVQRQLGRQPVYILLSKDRT
jgi:hypothetical protein